MWYLQICIQIHNYIICSCCVCSIRPCHFISRICKSGINSLYHFHSQPSKDLSVSPALSSQQLCKDQHVTLQAQHCSFWRHQEEGRETKATGTATPAARSPSPHGDTWTVVRLHPMSLSTGDRPAPTPGLKRQSRETGRSSVSPWKVQGLL